MRAVSIRQPWIEFVFRLDKRIENRTYRVNPGPILLHASGTKPRQEDLVEIFEDIGITIKKGPKLTPDLFMYGAILGAAVVTECFELDTETVSYEEAVAADETMFWAEGPICWRLDDVVPLKNPVDWKGAAGIFHVPDDAVRPSLPKRWVKKWMP